MKEELEKLNAETQKAFESNFDISEDFNFEDMDQFQSGAYVEADDDDKLEEFGKLMIKSPVSLIQKALIVCRLDHRAA